VVPRRLARPSDVPRIGELMRQSVVELFPHFHTAEETAGAAGFRSR
jgi:hypothetical protein